MSEIYKRAWVEINLDNIAHNIKEIKKIIAKNVKVMAVVKADAYGHGFKETSKTLIENGADYLAVALIDEAKQLRKHGIEAPIIILGYTAPEYASELVKLDITQTVYDYDLAEAISRSAVSSEKKAKIHIKIDTGMTRIGFVISEEAIKTIIKITELPMIEIEGIYTHFAAADEEDSSYTELQYKRFTNFCTLLEEKGLRIPIKHACNSAGIMRFPHMHLDMVRPGIILYGLCPSRGICKGQMELKAAMELKAFVANVKIVPRGTPVSYGRTYETLRETKVATIPIGYADGFSRLLSGKANLIAGEKLVPVIGRICMDYCMADVTDVEEIKVGDEVIAFGKRGDLSIFVDDIAENIGTINYEIVSAIGKRIPRVYIRDGNVSDVLNYLV